MDPAISQIIQDAATRNGVDPDTLGRFAAVESSGNPNAGATTSSAKGLFQFTDPTWKQYGNGGDPFDPAANADAAARLLRDNSAGLKGAGYEVTPGNAYLGHFAGIGGAKKILAADPGAPVASVLGEGAVAANPFLKGMSVADMRAWADRKMGGGAPVAPGVSTGPAAPIAAAGILNQTAAAPIAAGAPGLLNGAAPQEAEPVDIGAALASATPEHPQGLPMAPIRFVAPKGFDRAKFLAALTARRIA